MSQTVPLSALSVASARGQREPGDTKRQLSAEKKHSHCVSHDNMDDLSTELPSVGCCCCLDTHRVRRRLCGISAYMTYVFAILMIVLILVIIPVTWVLPRRMIQRAAREVHDVHITTVLTRAASWSRGVSDAVSTLINVAYADVLPLDPVNMSETILCKVVGSVMLQWTTMVSISLLSQTLNEATSCFAAFFEDNHTPMNGVLASAVTRDGVYQDGAYLVDADTFRYVEPRQLAFDPPVIASNVSTFFRVNVAMNELIDMTLAYRNGTGPAPAKSLSWSNNGLKPSSLTFAIAFPAYESEAAMATRVPDGRAVLQSRFDFRGFFRDGFLSDATRGLLLSSTDVIAGDLNPQLVAFSWEWNVTEEETIWMWTSDPNYTPPRLADIVDPVMRSALDHVDISILASPDVEETVTFRRGVSRSRVQVTYGHFVTHEGMPLIYVVVDDQRAMMGPVHLESIVIVASALALLVLLLTVFPLVMHAHVGRPLRRIGTSLSHAGELQSVTQRSAICLDSALVVSEVAELVTAHNEAIAILNQLEPHVQFVLRCATKETNTVWFADDLDMINDMAVNSTGNTAWQPGATFSAPFSTADKMGFSSTRQTRQTVASVVTVRTYPRTPLAPLRLPDADTDTESMLLGEAAPSDVAIRIKSAAVPSVLPRSSMEALRVLDDDPYIGPTPSFSTHAAVENFVEAVLRLTAERGGTVAALTPELATVRFAPAMRTLFTRLGAGPIPDTLASRAAAHDAMLAVHFAESLVQLLDASDASGDARPGIHAVVETHEYLVSPNLKIGCLDEHRSVALGRHYGGLLTSTAHHLDVPVLAMTGTVERVSQQYPAVPCHAFFDTQTITALGQPTVECLYAMLTPLRLVDGNSRPAERSRTAELLPASSSQQREITRAFSAMVGNDYKTALRVLDGLTLQRRRPRSAEQSTEWDARCDASVDTSQDKSDGAAGRSREEKEGAVAVVAAAPPASQSSSQPPTVWNVRVTSAVVRRLTRICVFQLSQARPLRFVAVLPSYMQQIMGQLRHNKLLDSARHSKGGTASQRVTGDTSRHRRPPQLGPPTNHDSCSQRVGLEDTMAALVLEAQTPHHSSTCQEQLHQQEQQQQPRTQNPNLHAWPTAMKTQTRRGVSRDVWCVPLRKPQTAHSAGNDRVRLDAGSVACLVSTMPAPARFHHPEQEIMVMSTTGAISYADELDLTSEAVAANLDEAEMAAMILRPVTCPYLVQIDDIIVMKEEQTVALVYAFLPCPTCASFTGLFAYRLPPSQLVCHVFSSFSALAALDFDGYVHTCLTPQYVLGLQQGMTRLKCMCAPPSYIFRTFRNLPTSYRSPEVVAGQPVTIYSNVFSLALIIQEFATESPPWQLSGRAPTTHTLHDLLRAEDDNHSIGFETAVTMKWLVPVMQSAPLGLPDDVATLYKGCTHDDPAQRPHPKVIVQAMRRHPAVSALIRHLPSGPWEL